MFTALPSLRYIQTGLQILQFHSQNVYTEEGAERMLTKDWIKFI